MPTDTARVLRFRPRRATELSLEEADACVVRYLALSPSERIAEADELLSNPDFLLSLTRTLRRDCDGSAATVAEIAEYAYQWLDEPGRKAGFFDEGDFFRGELALISGSACRQLGRLQDAELWLDRAESAFGLTINPFPSLAAVTYARISIHYDRANYDHVLAVMPTLLRSFERLEMSREILKGRFVQAMALKMLGRTAECLLALQSLCSADTLRSETDLHALALINLGELLLAEGRASEASHALTAGRDLVMSGNASLAGAHLCAVLGEALNHERRFEEATAAYRASVAAYNDLGMAGWVAYMRLVLAENLLAMGECRQAEWEVLAALPAIDEQRLEPHARVAVALLAKSVQSRQTDSRALSEVRGYLKNAG